MDLEHLRQLLYFGEDVFHIRFLYSLPLINMLQNPSKCLIDFQSIVDLILKVAARLFLHRLNETLNCLDVVIVGIVASALLNYDK